MDWQQRLEDAETIRDGLDGSARPEPAPERIGPYRIVGRLGSGGMGEVFLAWDERLERRVAIKRIRQDLGLSAVQRDRFRRVARLAARLSHSAIVQVHDIVSEGPDDAIVMEYVEGRTLADLLHERLEMPQILRLAREIAEGLAAAHDEGLIHRDLKTVNVIVTGTGHAKILDFGLARPVDRAADDPNATRQGVILGTCYAMSPEQARGEELDQRSDLFSFGSLVHEMLTGLPPFRGKNQIDSLRRVLTEEPVDPLLARPDLPAEAACLLRRLLQKDRNDRPRDASEVVEILESLRPSASFAVAPQTRASDQPTGDSTTLELPAPFPGRSAPAPPRKPLPWIRRHVLLVGIAAALFLGGAVGLYLALRPPQAIDDHFQEIKDRVDNGEVRRADLAWLQERIDANPRSLKDLLLAARISHGLFQEQRDPAYLERASKLIRSALVIAPNDSSPLFQAADIAFSRNDFGEADTLIKQLKAAVPSDSRLLPLQARFAEKQGRTDDARTLLNQAVSENASWQHLYRLADFEVRHGRVDEARRQVEILLKKEPENSLAWEQLGHLALSYDDLDQAESIYRGLRDSDHPERAYGNLGTVEALRGNYQGAADQYNEALERRPNYLPALINLAEVELELGRKPRSNELYRQARKQLENIKEQNGLSAYEAMALAQCLARLGQIQEAVDIAQRQIERSPDDPHLLVQSALIYILAGDLPAAQEAAQAALEKGISRRLFASSVFRSLRESPELSSWFKDEGTGTKPAPISRSTD